MPRIGGLFSGIGIFIPGILAVSPEKLSPSKIVTSCKTVGINDRIGMDKQLPGRIDPLLEPLLPPANDNEAREYLSQLIAAHAEPVIKGVIRHKLHLSPHDAAGQADADDLRQEAVLQLLAELLRFRQRPEEHPIKDMRGLAAVIAHRACSRWMRRRFPERHALKNRLYYLLTHQSGFALWKNDTKKPIAGFAAWQGQREVAGPERLKQLFEDGKLAAQIRLLTTGKQKPDLGAALAVVLQHLGSPVEFENLVGALAPLMPISDTPMDSMDQNEGANASAAAGERDPAWQVEKRIFLQRLWDEVRRLPLNQRAALLLNLKAPRGGGCIELFPATGVATLRQLAETLEMSAQRFAELWSELPLEDARIAELLQLTRQQVINARKSARERLARNLRGFI